MSVKTNVTVPDGRSRLAVGPITARVTPALCRATSPATGGIDLTLAHDGRSDQLHDTLAALALFADLTDAELESIAHTMEERYFAEGERILRQGFSGSGFYIVLEGEAAARVNGVEVNRLGRGDFFGEISVLLGEPPSADIVALRPLRCAVLAGPQVEEFVVAHPKVAYRMLQAEARKLRNATRWRS